MFPKTGVGRIDVGLHDRVGCPLAAGLWGRRVGALRLLGEHGRAVSRSEEGMTLARRDPNRMKVEFDFQAS